MLIQYRAFQILPDGKARRLGELFAACNSEARQIAFERYRRNYDGLAVVAVR